MDENNNNFENTSQTDSTSSSDTHSSYGAPTESERENFGKEKPVNETTASASNSATESPLAQATASASAAEEKPADSTTSAFEAPLSSAESTPSFSETTSSSTGSTTTSAFSLADNNTSATQSTSHQEVFGGSVEGTPAQTNNYYTNNNVYSSEPEEISKGFAIASLVMGILCFLTCCCWFLSIIFGILGIIFYCVQQKDSEGKRPTQATIGLIFSIVGLVIAIGMLIFGLAASGSSWYQDILNNASSV
jgi:cobalamin biosynthesis Mg chelatase CobN